MLSPVLVALDSVIITSFGTPRLSATSAKTSASGFVHFPEIKLTKLSIGTKR